MELSALDGYEIAEFEHSGKSKTVLRIGSGPAVIVMSEIPGITPKVAEFGRKVAGIGCTAILPSLFGVPGEKPTLGNSIRTLQKACISREFTALMTRKTSPVTDWLRALAAFEHGRCGGPGVGAIGMCFTGGFALGMMLDERLVAPVLSQPSLPLPFGKKRKKSIGISNSDLEVAKSRVDSGVCILGLRFSNDSMVPSERFARLHEEFGDGFVSVEIDSSPGNTHGISTRAHSVLTEEFVDEPGHPTFEALKLVLEHLKEKLIAV
ncbi:MAG: dienelactone hydrolase family protein [Acidimicrobiales bacterium]